MRNSALLYISFILLTILNACSDKKIKTHNPIKAEDVSAWCIIGFDSLQRTPQERIEMLKTLGIKKYGFNRGDGKLDHMEKEFKLAKENNIEINSIFLWLNASRDTIGQLSPANMELLSILKKVEYKPTIWLSFSHNFFDELNEEQSLELSIKMIESVKSLTDELGCKLALYNHHGWFGNPLNQVKIIEKLKSDSLSIVFNFHHAHPYLDTFSNIAKEILPYLSYVNIDGVKKDGPQILPVGSGDYELEMIKTLMAEGYTGPWGILGHIKSEDVQKVLQGNLDGLAVLNSKL